MSRGVLGLALLLRAAAASAGDFDSWRWHHAALLARDPGRAGERSVAAAVELDGNGFVLDPDPDGTVRAYVILPAEALEAYEAAIRRIDNHAARDWNDSRSSSTARIALLRREIDAFSPYAEAMPTLASYLQRECDRAYTAAHGIYPHPFIVIVVASGRESAERSAVLETLLRTERARRPQDDLHILTQRHGPRNVRAMRPIVSPGSQREIRPNEPGRPDLDRARGGFHVLKMSTPSADALKRVLLAYSKPMDGLGCKSPGLPPDTEHHHLYLDFELEQAKVSGLIAAALTKGSIRLRQEAPPDLSVRREYLDRLEALQNEGRSYREFLSSRDILGRIQREAVAELRSDIARIEQGLRRVCVSVKARETR